MSYTELGLDGAVSSAVAVAIVAAARTVAQSAPYAMCFMKVS
ncbi:MAG: hypothetical protein AB7G47_14745 [Mycolicibacterium sp.]